jgi:hypothetical protein
VTDPSADEDGVGRCQALGISARHAGARVRGHRFDGKAHDLHDHG